MEIEFKLVQTVKRFRWWRRHKTGRFDSRGADPILVFFEFSGTNVSATDPGDATHQVAVGAADSPQRKRYFFEAADGFSQGDGIIKDFPRVIALRLFSAKSCLREQQGIDRRES